eukprot:TRINITY_DN2634_c0_g2_i4.p1 TRINITY_DN2634_c0_g2~~TRINITY_DN2634_c0_g2_i4.p1  ORF type:complete len:228 (-),score=31.10 TRINITY_DN2634_c0_g2_i4:774-1457(-)
MNLSATQYNMFFSFYFIPNIVLPLFTGYFADLFGRKLGLLICSAVLVVGHFFFALGISNHSFAMSVIGRLIYGIGADSYQTIALECLSFWNLEFLSMSMAIHSAAEGLGSGLNNFLLPQLYAITQNLPLGFWIGFVFAILCLLTAVLFGLIESCASNSQALVLNHELPKLSGMFKFPLLFWLLTFQVCFFCGNTNSFSAIMGGMVQIRFGFNVQEAGVLIVIFAHNE